MRQEIEVRENGSRRVRQFCDEPSRTRQEFKQECDLNHILKKFAKTPEGMEALSKAQGFIGGQFFDATDMPDYRSTLDYIRHADEAFMRLPAEIRRRFNNQTAEYLDFVVNPQNQDELVKMGLMPQKAKSPVEGGSPTPTAG